MRLIVNRGFTPTAINRLEHEVRALVTQLCNDTSRKAGPDQEVDFVTEIAGRLPAAVIGAMLGVPASDHAQLCDWGFKLLEEIQAGTLGDAVAAIFAYASALAADREQAPREDVATRIVQAEVEGRRLTVEEFALFFMMLFFAGTHTTRSAASQGLLSLLEHPDQRLALVANAGNIPFAVEEIVRYSTPIACFQRVARRAVTLRDKHIVEGDAVALWFTAANRDPDVFAEPHRFDVSRDPNPHVAFGAGGPHFCLGAQLARLELRVLFEVLLDRYPEMTLAGTPTRTPSFQLPGVASLPVRLGIDRHTSR
jgi:cholest-4-en-3-one 26-monooxygenase